MALGGLEDLVALQYDARQQDVSARFPRAVDLLVLLDGDPVGRLWVDQHSRPWRVLDLAVAIERRRQGIGSEVLGALLGEAEEARVEVALSVERLNGAAIALYRRLGFEEVGGDEVHLTMLFRP